MKIKRKKTSILTYWFTQHKLPILITLGVLVVAGASLGILLLLNKGSDEGPIADEPTITEPEPEPPKFHSTLTGLEIANPDLDSSPITCIMIENSPDARPHSGLTDAAIVYEAIAEGGITRFATIWQNSDTNLIGPVRSIRPYYIDWMAPYNCSIAHVGGSDEALSIIRNKNNGFRDIDQFYNAASYWRASDRAAPHNVYTNFSLLDSLNAKKGYTSSEFSAFKRATDDTAAQPDADSELASTIEIKISSALYNPTYTYDDQSNTYFRAYGTTPHMSTVDCPPDVAKPLAKNCDTVQLAPRVVIAIMVDQRLQADGTHQSITTTGNGTAYIFQSGTVVTGTWEKLSRNDQIKFYDAEGKIIPINPGQVWISAVPNLRGSVTYK